MNQWYLLASYLTLQRTVQYWLMAKLDILKQFEIKRAIGSCQVLTTSQHTQTFRSVVNRVRSNCCEWLSKSAVLRNCYNCILFPQCQLFHSLLRLPKKLRYPEENQNVPGTCLLTLPGFTQSFVYKPETPSLVSLWFYESFSCLMSFTCIYPRFSLHSMYYEQMAVSELSRELKELNCTHEKAVVSNIVRQIIITHPGSKSPHVGGLVWMAFFRDYLGLQCVLTVSVWG